MRTTSTARRFLVILAAALVLQGTLFAVYYDDLIFLRQPLPQIASGAARTFVQHAEAALERSRLTTKHLDTIADGARQFGEHDLEVRALLRQVAARPDDRFARLRLGDALRRAGRLAEAETVFLDLLSSGGSDQP